MGGSQAITSCCHVVPLFGDGENLSLKYLSINQTPADATCHSEQC